PRRWDDVLFYLAPQRLSAAVERGRAAPAAGPSPKPLLTPAPMEVNGVTLVLIEDDLVDAEAIQRAFRKQTLANPFVVFPDGVEALRALRREPGAPEIPQPYIILLDINMPRMNGLEFLRSLRTDPVLQRDIVFVLTTSERDEDKLEAYG